MSSLVLVFLGGGLGSVLRYLINVASLALFGAAFPVGTLFVNAAGGIVMGLIAGTIERGGFAGWSSEARYFLMTGILGGFTTFSAFSLDAVTLWERGAVGLAIVYVGASVVLAIGGIAAGLFLARSL
jgi:CrcB protein